MSLHLLHTPPPNLHFVMKLRVELAAPVELGEIAGVSRRIVPITGGRFEGPLLRGEVLVGGADWQYIRVDGVSVLEARYALKTHDGNLITVVNRGYRHGPPNLAARIESGTHVSPSEYYFMSSPVFETASPELQWMSRMVFVGQGERTRDCVLLSVWQVGEDATANIP
jgi:hypothetical protein